MAILRPTWQDIITEHSVQTWQDWPWETWLGPYVVISPRRYRVRVRVYRAGEWVDITSRIASGVIRESNDQPVATLELRLLNGREYPSLAPRRKDSPLNQVNGQYVPLLWIGRLIAVEAAFSEDGSEPNEWWPVFLGELEDEIDTESGPDGTYVRLFCRDLAALLQRDYIMGPLVYENMFATDMIQKILDDRYSAGALPEPVTLTVIGEDDFFVERYEIEYMDTWSALQRFCQQRGTDLRYRLNEQTGQIELTYWLPDRAMVPGWIIDASQIHREELRISGTDIINRVTVRYRDAQTGQRAGVTVQDADSIAMYGLRHGLIEEPDTDLIPDAATAQKLAQSIVEDLKDVPLLTRLTVPFDPRVQVFDKLRVTNPAVRDEAEDYAIEERELSFTATEWHMVLVGSGRVVVKRHMWLERLAKEGVKRPFTPRDTTTSLVPPAPTIVEAKSVPGGVQLSLEPPLGLYWNGFVIHASKTPNFTPSVSTEVAWGSETRFSILGLDPGELYYFKAQAMDFARNRSAPSNEVQAYAGRLTPDGLTAVVGNALVTTDADQDVRIAVGDISGRPWAGEELPPGTYGIWGERAGLFLRGYLHNVQAGFAQDGDFVPLDFVGHPTVILIPADMQIYESSESTENQRLILEAANVTPQGFTVVAKLVKESGAPIRHTFGLRNYNFSSHFNNSYCTNPSSSGGGSGNHSATPPDPPLWSDEYLINVNEAKLYQTTRNTTTRVTFRLRGMAHVRAPAGNYDSYQEFDYELRIRPVGATQWMRTLGPFRVRAFARSSTFSADRSHTHRPETRTFDNLPPDQYEIEVRITRKAWNRGGNNESWLIVEWWEEEEYEEIVPISPQRVWWIAFESDTDVQSPD